MNDTEPVALDVRAWPITIHLRSTWFGYRWEGTYSYGLAEVHKVWSGVPLPFVAYGRNGGNRLRARFVAYHQARYPRIVLPGDVNVIVTAATPRIRHGR